MKRIRDFFNDEDKVFIWIHGLPGSGKSYLTKKILTENPDIDFVIYDDSVDISDVKNSLKKGEDIIFNSPFYEEYFANNTDRIKEVLRNTDYKLIEFWFENDPEKCINNVRKRKNHKFPPDSVISNILDFTRKYKIPNGAITLPIHN